MKVINGKVIYNGVDVSNVPAAEFDWDNFLEFCYFELTYNNEWFEGYNAWTDNDFDDIISNQGQELWDIYMEEYNGSFPLSKRGGSKE